MLALLDLSALSVPLGPTVRNIIIAWSTKSGRWEYKQQEQTRLSRHAIVSLLLSKPHIGKEFGPWINSNTTHHPRCFVDAHIQRLNINEVRVRKADVDVDEVVSWQFFFFLLFAPPFCLCRLQDKKVCFFSFLSWCSSVLFLQKPDHYDPLHAHYTPCPLSYLRPFSVRSTILFCSDLSS